MVNKTSTGVIKLGCALRFHLPSASSLTTEATVEKAFVAQRVANKLFATENAIDAAMVEASEMMSEMLKARKELGVSAVVGDQASAKLVEAIAALGAARTAMVEAHGVLGETKLRLGIRTKLAGFEMKEASAASVREARRQAS
ncbi:hypothetical protein [Caulobacter segnis]|uniref:hypothetical protein n=1 Tax=Caulobacter segnis TaxID=88688 RepID=UPI0032206CA0